MDRFGFILIYCICHSISGSVLIDNLDNYNCLRNVIHQAYNARENIAFINLNDSTWLANIRNPFININSRNNLVFNKYPYTNYVIEVNNFHKLFFDIVHIKQSKLWDAILSPRGKYIVLTENQNDIEEMMKFLFSEDIYKVIVVQLKKHFNETSFISSDPYDMNNYKNMQYHTLGTCKNYSRVNFINYNTKNKNLNLTFCCYEFDLPYMGNFGQSGTRMSSLKLISRKLNMSLVILQNKGENQEFFATGKTEKLKHLIYGKHIDMFFVSNYYSYYFEEYEVTDYFMYDPPIWLIAAPEQMSNLEQIIQIFDFPLWMLIFITLIFTAIFAWLIGKYKHEKHFENISTSFMNLYSGMLNIPFPMRIKSTSLKLCIVFYWLYTFHVTYNFQGELSSFLTTPSYKPGITNLEEVVESNVIPILKAYQIKMFRDMNITLATKLSAKSVPIEGRSKIPHNVVKYVKNNKNSCMTSYESIFHVYQSYNIRILSGRFLEPHTESFGFRKGHPLFNTIDRIIRIIFEGGFNNRWLNHMRNRSKMEFSENVGFIALNNDHFQGVFILLSIGLVIAFVIFLIEVLYSKLKLKK